MVRQEEGTTRLPSGYQLDLGGDPCVVDLRREDGTVVARFTRNVDTVEIRRAAEEDLRGTPGAWRKDSHFYIHPTSYEVCSQKYLYGTIAELFRRRR